MVSENIPFSVLVLTGPVGAGKTTVAIAISEILDKADVAHGFIDVDAIRWCHPSPPHDPFNMKLGLRNLAAVAANYRDAGAERLILSDVVETQEDKSNLAAALPDAVMKVVRLKAEIPTLHQRLEKRETGESLEWHKHRAIELTELMERNSVEDLLIDTEGKTPEEIAREILSGAGWCNL